MIKRSLLLALLLALLPRLVSAQGEAPSDDEVNLIAKKLFCPVCENVPLDVCPTQACAQWRATIREKLVEGWTEQQILDYFVQQYGERVLAQPSSRGLNFLVWLLPPLALAAGAFFLWRFLSASARVRLSATPAQAAPSLPPTDKYAAMLEEELRKRR